VLTASAVVEPCFERTADSTLATEAARDECFVDDDGG
jgi:hypothetical protein